MWRMIGVNFRNPKWRVNDKRPIPVAFKKFTKRLKSAIFCGHFFCLSVGSFPVFVHEPLIRPCIVIRIGDANTTK